MPKKTQALPSVQDVLAQFAKAGLYTADFEIPEQRWISTGNMALDSITNGGIPIGRVTQLAGAQGSGKTTTAVAAAAKVIEQGGIVAFWDYERTLDRPYFQALGVDVDDKEHFLYFRPETLEDGANMAVQLTRKTKAIDLHIFDSVAKMVTKNEKEGEIGSLMIGERGKLMYQFLRQFPDDLAASDSAAIFLNHLLEKIDLSFFGQQMAKRGVKQYTYPGGNALLFFSSLILQFEKSSPVTTELFDPITNEEKKTNIGYEHKVKVIKNKTGKDGAQATVINIIGEGFSQSRTAFEILKAYGILKQNGTWYSIKDSELAQVAALEDNKIQGKENLYNAIFSNAGARGLAISKAREVLAEQYETLEVNENGPVQEPVSFGEGFSASDYDEG